MFQKTNDHILLKISKISRWEELICKLDGKKRYLFAHMFFFVIKGCLFIKHRNALNHVLGLKKANRVIKFNQEVWLGLKMMKKKKKFFWRNFSKFINNAVFGKTIENILRNKSINQTFKRLEKKLKRLKISRFVWYWKKAVL